MLNRRLLRAFPIFAVVWLTLAAPNARAQTISFPVPSNVGSGLQGSAVTGSQVAVGLASGAGPTPLPPCSGPPSAYGRLLKSYTFENGSGGASTEGWTSVDSSGFGDYATLVSGAAVVQEDPVNTNPSHFWSFYGGSSTNYACGGFPGQAAVPKTNNPGSHVQGDYIHNMVASPWIDLSVDMDGAPVPASFQSVALTFDVYADLPFDNLVFYDWRIRFRVGGVPTAWQDDKFVYYSNQKVWLQRGFDFAVKSIPPGATDVQVEIGVRDMLWVWYDFGSGACHSHAPLIDNVCVSRTNGKVHVVTSTADDNSLVTLRRAISDCNARPGQDVIFFNIPGPGSHTIKPTSTLPIITDELIIDGFTQPGASPNTNPIGSPSNAVLKIDLDGSFTSTGGLAFQSAGTLRGIAIHTFSQNVTADADFVVIEGNYIGTDPSGTTQHLNPSAGVLITGNHCRVGGAAPSARNVIGSNFYGVLVLGGGNTDVYGNYIGIGADASTPLGNEVGVLLQGGAHSTRIGSANAGEANVIAYNDNGVAMVDPFTIDNLVLGNSIHHSASMGIDLGLDGYTPNDFLDFDIGPNHLQNFPDVSSASGNQVDGAMHGAFNQSLKLDFYRSSQAYSSCSAEVYMGQLLINTDGGGNAPFTFTPAQPIPPESYIVATATDANGNTSELSSCIVSENTPPGSDVAVDLVDASNAVRGTATYGNVTSSGNTFLANPFTPPVPVSANFTVGNPNDPSIYFDVTTNVSYSGGVDVCLFYDEGNIPGPEANLVIAHYNGSTWEDVTTTRDLVNNKICGHVTTLSPFVIAVLTPTGVGNTPVPTSFALRPNVPNPFNPVTTISYDIPAGGADVNITIYDVAGRLVRSLVDEHRAPGTWSVPWNGEDDHGVRVASGVYFYRMRAGEFVETKKMVLLK